MFVLFMHIILNLFIKFIKLNLFIYAYFKSFITNKN